MNPLVPAAFALVALTVALLTRPWWWRTGLAASTGRIAAVALLVVAVAAGGYWMLHPEPGTDLMQIAAEIGTLVAQPA